MFLTANHAFVSPLHARHTMPNWPSPMMASRGTDMITFSSSTGAGINVHGVPQLSMGNKSPQTTIDWAGETSFDLAKVRCRKLLTLSLNEVPTLGDDLPVIHELLPLRASEHETERNVEGTRTTAESSKSCSLARDPLNGSRGFELNKSPLGPEKSASKSSTDAHSEATELTRTKFSEERGGLIRMRQSSSDSSASLPALNRHRKVWHHPRRPEHIKVMAGNKRCA
mmetsp:Transcript_100815/g.289761  ORF Transcript_100815/g.289761 Transcript_100815/m.289761 type:complete len:226 (-) Transcript_100815:57-734(-)